MGDGVFAECPRRNSAKELLLPSVCPTALGKESIFAECHRGHSAKNPPGRVPMSGSFPSVLCGTRQRGRLCRVPPWTLGKEPAREGPHVRFFAECYVRHSAKRASLPSARDITLGKVTKPVPRSLFFAGCYDPGTRQSTYLPSVTLGKVTSRHLFYLFLYSIHTNKRYHIYISHIYITDIITNINSQHKHK
jgi:hypothetical protein